MSTRETARSMEKRAQGLREQLAKIVDESELAHDLANKRFCEKLTLEITRLERRVREIRGW